MSLEQQGPRSGVESSRSTSTGGGAPPPHPALPLQETPQHGVNRGDFPSPQGEAGSWAGSQWGNGPRRVPRPAHMPSPGARMGGGT